MDENIVNRSFHMIPTYVSMMSNPQHALELETYKKLTDNFKNVWFDVNEDKSFHLI